MLHHVAAVVVAVFCCDDDVFVALVVVGTCRVQPTRTNHVLSVGSVGTLLPNVVEIDRDEDMMIQLLLVKLAATKTTT